MPYHEDDRRSVGPGAIFALIFSILFIVLIVYLIYCSFNWYFCSLEYMKDNICQQKEMNTVLKEISDSMKNISNKCD